MSTFIGHSDHVFCICFATDFDDEGNEVEVMYSGGADAVAIAWDVQVGVTWLCVEIRWCL